MTLTNTLTNTQVSMYEIKKVHDEIKPLAILGFPLCYVTGVTSLHKEVLMWVYMFYISPLPYLPAFVVACDISVFSKLSR